MRFGVLGPLAVWSDLGEPVTVPGRKVRALLAALLVNEGRPVSADRLVEDLWGATDARPADPTAALHVRVSQLRRALASAGSAGAAGGAGAGGRGLVVSQAPGYALHPDARVDAAEFATLVADAQRVADPSTRAKLLGEALGLWRGPALADFADEEFARVAAARWEERRIAAVEAYAEARLALGEHAEVAAELAAPVVEHPFRERLRAAHLRALYRSGRVTEALDGYRELRSRLADELGLEPGADLVALHRAILAGDPAEDAPAAPQERSVVRLPAPVTELLGRAEALARVRELLAAGRLVTVTGPGGVGKTSVALAVAWSVADAYPDGVWLVDLTTWDGRGDPADPVLSVLPVPEAPGGSQPPGERLAAALRERRALLVLDNCEHVAEPVADLVGGLLAAAPGLRILATGREPLRVRGEARFDLPPLEVPDTDDPARLADSAAVRLFLSRAGVPSPDDATVAGAAEVCRRLDGLPLALELAATRVAGLGIPELVARLSLPHDRFGLLATGPRDAPARQRTLAAVIDWSWRLLSGPEQVVLRRLSVHAGGCTLASAEAVCADGPVLDLLTGLVDRSLVVRREGRYRLLESVAAFCLDRLREAGEEGAVRRRHADHFLDLAERADPELRGRDQRGWLDRLEPEAANLRAAQDTYHRTGAAGRALRLATALVWYRYLRGRLTEARRSLAAALELAAAAEVPADVRAVARAWHAGLALRQGLAGPECVAEALGGFDADADPLVRARVEWFLAGGVVEFGDGAATGALLTASHKVFTGAGDRWGEAAVLSTRAMLAHMRDDAEALEHDARRAAAVFRSIGDEWGVLQATDWLIGLADLTGDTAEAARLSRAGLESARDLGLWAEVAGRLGWLAWTSTQAGDHVAARGHGERARRLSAEQGNRAGEVFATISVAFAARRDGDEEAAAAHLDWLLATAREQTTAGASPPYLPMVLVERGLLLSGQGAAARALAAHREAFELSRAQGSPRGTAWALAGMAAAVLVTERSDLAAELLGTADAVWRGTGQPMSDSDRAELARTTEAVRAGSPTFDALFAAGAARTPSEAVALVQRGV
ncbi:BTAD domain-containing putative transcriptional regulator [Virgisporangium aurantiacum]|uniref:BTAD domain-containing putative transcriptional regulator n=1 Tax=Virgisporangium aurantiacum TaxID=175570 RepID=UPI00194DDB5A|nr:BTAD domain-containing putative transcriptional regulator [Virgisporangium aurantiacum]